MAVKKIRMRPEGTNDYGDILHPETSADQVIASDGVTTFESHLADGAHVPKGLISMWSGLISAIPNGWALCDGQNGTPDLRDRFIMGATSDGDVGETGGQNEVTLTVDQMPSHSHSGSTNSAGSHSHTLASPDGDSGAYAVEYTQRSNTSGHRTSTAGSHSHTLSIHNTGGGQPHENRPAFYKLAFIMKA